MKKQGFAFLLGLCWLISLASHFSFSEVHALPQKDSDRQTVVGEFQEIQPFFRNSYETLKTPPFEIDVRLLAKLNSDWIPDFAIPFKVYFPSSFFQKSRALFDVKRLFVQYFYSW